MYRLGYSWRVRLTVPRGMSCATLFGFPVLVGSCPVSGGYRAGFPGRPWFPSRLPGSEDGTNTRNKAVSPPGAPVRSRVGKWGSCSPTPTVVSPGSAVVRGRAASSRGPSVVSSVPFAALDHTLMASLTAGDNRERGERVGTSPNARLQSCLGFAVRSAKHVTQKASGALRGL